jgi:membrane associated rhomboid family serine protease
MPDLPARRRGPPGWTRPITERLTPVIKGLILTMVALYAIYVFVREARPLVETHLAIGTRLFRGEVWQPLTSMFVHVDPLLFAMDLLGIWFTGAQLERVQGTRRFLTMFFLAGVLSNLTLAGIDHLRMAGLELDVAFTTGSAYAVLAMFVAFGRIYDRTQTQILGGLFVQSRHMAIFFVGWFALAALFRQNWGELGATLVATAVGFLGAAPGGWDALRKRFKVRRMRRRYKVLEGGNRPSKKYLN